LLPVAALGIHASSTRWLKIRSLIAVELRIERRVAVNNRPSAKLLER
jgi:hypothetical protein